MDELAKLISALSSLAWPIVAAVILFKLLEPLRELVNSAKGRKFTIKVAGNELTMEEASEQQRAIVSDLQVKVAELERLLTPSAQVLQPDVAGAEVRRSRVLWVDDNPKNNSFLVASLEERGVQVDIALTTNDGLAMFKKRQYDAVISDMGRPEGEKAGLDLTRKIKALSPDTPVYVFCGTWAARHLKSEAIEAGVSAITSSGTTLLSSLSLSRED
jgi:CheY-like chemotaxis protein